MAAKIGLFERKKLGQPNEVRCNEEQDTVLFDYGDRQYVLFGKENVKIVLEGFIKYSSIKDVLFYGNGCFEIVWGPKTEEKK